MSTKSVSLYCEIHAVVESVHLQSYGNSVTKHLTQLFLIIDLFRFIDCCPISITPKQDLTKTRISGKLLSSFIWLRYCTFKLAWIWDRTEWNLMWHMNTTLRCLNWAWMKFVPRWRIDFSVVTLFVNTVKIYSSLEQTKSRTDMRIQKTQDNEQNQSSRSGKLGPYHIICLVEVKSRYPMGTCLLLLTKLGGC